MPPIYSAGGEAVRHIDHLSTRSLFVNLSSDETLKGPHAPMSIGLVKKSDKLFLSCSGHPTHRLFTMH